jgi:tRNA (guanine37-N1)-methyltransferase
MSHISIVTIFEEFFDSTLSVSIPARAIEAGAARVDFADPRDFATDTHRTVDDSPYGGGAGMVMRAPELGAAVESCQSEEARRPVILMSPQGRRFDQRTARRLAESEGFVLVCGRYEGVDERFVEEHVDEELSVGDFVLSGGEPAAMVVVDAVLRLLPDVLGNEASLDVESFGSDRLEAPQFTRPPIFKERGIPDVLLSGHHQRIEDWRRKVSLLRTRARRPDLFEQLELTEEDQRVLGDESLEVEDWLIRPRFSRSGS